MGDDRELRQLPDRAELGLRHLEAEDFCQWPQTEPARERPARAAPYASARRNRLIQCAIATRTVIGYLRLAPLNAIGP
jgi:hypothetical protein